MAEEERGRRENSDETCAHLKSCRVSVAKMVVVVSEGGRGDVGVPCSDVVAREAPGPRARLPPPDPRCSVALSVEHCELG